MNVSSSVAPYGCSSMKKRAAQRNSRTSWCRGSCSTGASALKLREALGLEAGGCRAGPAAGGCLPGRRGEEREGAGCSADVQRAGWMGENVFGSYGVNLTFCV